MKSLAIIWSVAILVGIGTMAYAHQVLDNAVIKPIAIYEQLQPAQPIYLGNDTCLQQCKPINLQSGSSQLQPAIEVR